jgi:hypothetical protein
MYNWSLLFMVFKGKKQVGKNPWAKRPSQRKAKIKSLRSLFPMALELKVEVKRLCPKLLSAIRPQIQMEMRKKIKAREVRMCKKF